MLFLPKSNVSFSRWFKLYRFFCSIFLHAPLIEMRRFVFTNGWIVLTLCAILALWQRQLLHFFSYSTRAEPRLSKFLMSLWKSELKVAWQLLSSCLIKMFLIVFIIKFFCQIKIFPSLISYSVSIPCSRNKQTIVSD